jgi:hypothetical protein
MYQILFLTILLIFSSNASFSDRLCSEIYPKNAKNIVLVFLELHQNYNDSTGYCEGFSSNTFTDVIQIHYSIDEINKGLNASNFSIGVRICDSCQDENVARILTTENIVYVIEKLNLKIICKLKKIGKKGPL